MPKSKRSNTTFSMTDKRKAVTHTFSLVKNGHSITSARKIVAKDLKISPNTIWVWQHKFNMVTPKATLVKNNISLANTSKSTVTGNLGDVKGDLRRVHTSLIRKDGTYTNKDANTICQVTSTMLNISKHELQVHRYADKMRKRDKAVQNLLS